MNLLHILFGNRRKQKSAVDDDRRKSAAKRLQAASDRVNKAADDLYQTISMKREDFLLGASHDKLKVVLGTVDFVSFSENCPYRYSPKESLMKLCKHPEHEACKSGIAACRAEQCPEYLKASRK